MLPNEFSLQLKRLEDVFGEKYFTDERRRMIWRNVQDLNAGDLSLIVDHFIATMKMAPLPSDFREAAKRERLSKLKNKKTVRDYSWEPHCSKCLDTGFVNLQIDPQHPSSKVFAKCDCDIWSEKKQRKAWGHVELPVYSDHPDLKMHPIDFREWKPVDGLEGLNSKSELWREKMNISIEFFKGVNQ